MSIHGIAELTRIYVAVIEWPDILAMPPELIVERSAGARDVVVFEAVADMARARTDTVWSLILEGAPGNPPAVTWSSWKEWIEFHFEDADDRPEITYYERVI